MQAAKMFPLDAAARFTARDGSEGTAGETIPEGFQSNQFSLWSYFIRRS